jgi:hypothetical protein
MPTYIYRYRLVRVFALAILLFAGVKCEKAFDAGKTGSDPVAVFEEVWKVMDQRYALFEVKNVDWNAVYEYYRSRVSTGMSETDLFNVLGDMLDLVKDGHVSIANSGQTRSYDNFYTAFAANFNYTNLLNNYLGNDYITKGPLLYKIVDSVGYIYYKSFASEADAALLDNLFTDLSARTKGLILDVRDNTGGSSENSSRLFSHFIPAKTLVKFERMKRGPGHSDFYEPEAYYVSPASTVYKKRVAVLTNRKCFSTCNDFVLFMSSLENVKLYGDQTGGGGGIPQDYLLPNGWKLQYTASLTLSPQKQSIENGILPDVNVVISPIDESNGRDPILDRAFLSLK